MGTVVSHSTASFPPDFTGSYDLRDLTLLNVINPSLLGKHPMVSIFQREESRTDTAKQKKSKLQ